MNENLQIIKTRDDHKPGHLCEKDKGSRKFEVVEGCDWAKPKQLGTQKNPVTPEDLRARIEPWLTSLVQSEHVSLLVGSGLTAAVHELAIDKEADGEQVADKKAADMQPDKFSNFQAAIQAAATEAAKKAGRGEANFEDQIRAANELLRGLKILGEASIGDSTAKEQACNLEAEITEKIKYFSESVLKGEREAASANIEKRKNAFSCLVSFLMSFASRIGARERMHIFTTNYDRFIEAGADLAGLRLIDRFVGTLAPVFRASRLDVDMHYNPPGIRGEPRYLEGVARFTKLHGSLDWVNCKENGRSGVIRRIGLPFGAEDVTPYLKAPGLHGADLMEMMIYPNAAKDRETAEYPYVELFRDFAAAICRPNSTLFCYGYGFGDDHINRVIEDMLSIPSTNLVVMSYDASDRTMKKIDGFGRSEQTTLLLGNHLGDLHSLVGYGYLPKPAIDRTTIRMADLLRARMDPAQAQGHEQRQPSDNHEPNAF